MRQGLLSEPKASSDPAAMLLAVSRSPSSIPRRSPCPDRCHLPLASLSPSPPKNLKILPDCIPSQTDAIFLRHPSYTSTKTKKLRCPANTTLPDTRAKEQMSSGYSQSASLLAHNRITAHNLSEGACAPPDTTKSPHTAYHFSHPAGNLLNPVKPPSLSIHRIRLTPRNISFIIQRTIITSQMSLHNIRIPHN